EWGAVGPCRGGGALPHARLGAARGRAARESHQAGPVRGAERAVPLGSRGVPGRGVLLSRGVLVARGGAGARAGGRRVEVSRHDRVPLGARLRGNGAGILVHAALADTRWGSAPDLAGALVGVGFLQN